MVFYVLHSKTNQLGFGVLGFWGFYVLHSKTNQLGFGVLGFWGFGVFIFCIQKLTNWVLGFWGFYVLHSKTNQLGFGVLGFWGFGVLGFWGFYVLHSKTNQLGFGTLRDSPSWGDSPSRGTYEAGSPQIWDDSPSRGLPFLLSSSYQVWRLFFQGLFDCHRLLAVKHTPTLATTDSSAIRCYYCTILEIKVIYK